jgi:hypothetical protein
MKHHSSESGSQEGAHGVTQNLRVQYVCYTFGVQTMNFDGPCCFIESFQILGGWISSLASNAAYINQL